MAVDIEVVTSELRKEAVTWDDQSEAIGRVGVQAESLRLNYLTAGVFALVVADYESAVDQISARCAEGTTRMADIAVALRANATAYDQRDEEVSIHVDGAY